MIDVSSEVKCYEVNSQEVKGLDYPIIKVKSHWNHRDFVVLEIDGKTYAVSARDLTAAIENATNSAK